MDIPLIQNDPYLEEFSETLKYRITKAKDKEKELSKPKSLSDFANAHQYFGLHKTSKSWVYRDWIPNAVEVYLIGDFSDWQLKDEFKLTKKNTGEFEIKLNLSNLKHLDIYRLFIRWEGGSGDRIPAYAKRVVQDEKTNIFNAQVWNPDKPYKQKYPAPEKKDSVLIYEAHIGMASEEGKVATYDEFRKNILARIIKLGYDTIQLMAIQEHPYYGSFGYHVSNFFAASSRFGNA